MNQPDPVLVGKPDMPNWDGWIPKLDQMVWSTMSNIGSKPLGKVVGYVDAPGAPRHGQPVIETQEDESGLFGRKAGTLSICHPMFLWPFCGGSVEYEEAKAAGRFRD